MSTKENINTLFEKFENFIKSQTITGEEIKLGNVTIIPFSNISFSMGGGGANEKNEKGGDGLGMAAKATPTSILVVNSNDVKLIPIRKGSSFDTILEMVPSLVDKLSSHKSYKS